MKKIVIFILLCVFSANILAQGNIDESSSETTAESIVVDNHVVTSDFRRSHDLDINFGVPSFLGLTMSATIMPLLHVAAMRSYDIDFNTIGIYGINYHYQCLKWLKFGAKAQYEGYKSIFFQKNSTVFDHKNVTSIVSIMPSVQFTYLNREHVQLYSGIDIGCMMLIIDKKVAAAPMANITPIGICWGGDVYGVFEINIGNDAIGKIGIGYHIR